MSTALATLVSKLAKRLDLGDGSSLIQTLKATAFRQRGNDTVTDAQMEALLIVAEQYRLNPFTKELFAFADKGAIVPVVSVDGWSRIINEHPQLDGIEFSYSDEIVTMPRGKPCPAWCDVAMFRKDRSRPIVIREYLDEVYQAPRGKEGGYDGPWQTHTKRFMRHKTLIQGARVAFGFAGIYDQDEADRIVEKDMGSAEVVGSRPPARMTTTTALPDYSDADLNKNINAWAAAMQSGRTTPDRVVATVSSKYTLSEAQKAAIRDAASPSTDPEVITPPAASTGADGDGWLQGYESQEIEQ